ncbi:MAG: SEC-C metal-binding domain-containing protein, partial [Anaerovoracaceae bacterium]
MITRSIENAQKKVEGRNFSIRKYVLQYDNVMNKQREIIYDQRKMVLFGEDLKEYIANMSDELIDADIDPIVLEAKYPEEWDLDTLNHNLTKICERFTGVHYSQDALHGLTAEQLREDVREAFRTLYEEKEQEIGLERMRDLERMILIRVVDNKWMDHIDAMDQLKSGIGLRGLGGQDPAGAYATEGFDMFEEMIAAIKEETVKFCYNVTVHTTTERKEVFGRGEEMKAEFEGEQGFAGEELPGQQNIPEREKRQEPVKRDQPKVGRNDLCPCGSGKKYKHCCGRDE